MNGSRLYNWLFRAEKFSSFSRKSAHQVRVSRKPLQLFSPEKPVRVRVWVRLGLGLGLGFRVRLRVRVRVVKI